MFWINLYSSVFNLLYFVGKVFKVNNHAVSKNTYNIGVKYSWWQKIKNEFSLISYNGVTGVIAALIPDDDIVILA